jgi:hypothetical protein
MLYSPHLPPRFGHAQLFASENYSPLHRAISRPSLSALNNRPPYPVFKSPPAEHSVSDSTRRSKVKKVEAKGTKHIGCGVQDAPKPQQARETLVWKVEEARRAPVPPEYRERRARFLSPPWAPADSIPRRNVPTFSTTRYGHGLLSPLVAKSTRTRARRASRPLHGPGDLASSDSRTPMLARRARRNRHQQATHWRSSASWSDADDSDFRRRSCDFIVCLLFVCFRWSGGHLHA